MSQAPAQLSGRQRGVVVAAAFLGWLCAGIEMGLGPLVARPAARDLLFRIGGAVPAQVSNAQESEAGTWFAWWLFAFLLGGALGGLLFGRLGDRAGRVRAMGLSILCFSVLTGSSWFVQSPEQLFVLRFLASLGIGGMWPAGVALVAETWPDVSRPLVAGVMGAAANLGIFVMALMGWWLEVTPDSWRSLMLVGATPAVLGVVVLLVVPESPRWLAAQRQTSRITSPATPVLEIFRPPLLSRTVLGIGLGTVPLLGAWGSGKWLVPWADAHGRAATTQAVWALGAFFGGAVGGLLSNALGRRTTYFLVSLATLLINLLIYHTLQPAHDVFLPAVFALGLVATVFFGWLPLYLPELFPTRVRATGSGVAFNFGRFATAAGVLGAGALLALFQGDYARVGAVTAWVYALGMPIILLAPDTSKRLLDD
jgi:SHS family sialic acid transporter-like MFS transporter